MRRIFFEIKSTRAKEKKNVISNDGSVYEKKKTHEIRPRKE